MSITEPEAGERVKNVRFTRDSLVVDLTDGRSVSVPLAWYPRLQAATAAQRQNWRVSGAGFGIHGPDIDDLSVEGLLRGAPASRGSTVHQLATSSQRNLTRGGLLAPCRRRDSPRPASRRWLTFVRPSISAVACRSLPEAGPVR